MTSKQAARFVRAAYERRWLQASAAERCLEAHLAARGQGEAARDLDVLMVQNGLLTADQARELMDLPKPPAIHECRFIGRLADGPNGCSSLIEHLRSGQQLVIKILPKSLTKSHSRCREIEAMAYAAQRLEHYGTPHVLGVGCQEGEYYCLQQYIKGVTVGQVLDHAVPMRALVAVDYACRVASALRAGWRTGLWHGHLTASSIILADDGSVRLAGLGLLRVAPKRISLIARGPATYHPKYLSPEHFEARKPGRPPIDCRSDIFSLGWVLYEMITATDPFAGDSSAQVLQRLQAGPELEPVEAAPGVPPRLVAILSRMLAPDPAERYQAPDELLEDLQALRVPALPDAIPAEAIEITADADEEEETASPTTGPVVSRALVVAAVVAGAVLLAGAVLVAIVVARALLP